MGGGGETERGELWTDGASIVGEVGNNGLERMGEGVCLLAGAETASTGGD